MKNNLSSWGLKAGRISPRHVRIVLGIGTLLLFVLGAGAPSGQSDY